MTDHADLVRRLLSDEELAEALLTLDADAGYDSPAWNASIAVRGHIAAITKQAEKAEKMREALEYIAEDRMAFSAQADGLMQVARAALKAWSEE